MNCSLWNVRQQSLRRQKVVDDDIGSLDEALRDLRTRPRFQVHDDRFFVAIDRQEICTDIVYKRRTPAAGLIATLAK